MAGEYISINISSRFLLVDTPDNVVKIIIMPNRSSVTSIHPDTGHNLIQNFKEPLKGWE